MSKTQRVLIAMSCLLFAATLYSFFYLNVYLIILFFLLHSLCLILFCYRAYTDEREEAESAETYHQDIGMELAQKNNEISELQGRLAEKTSQIESLKQDYELLKETNQSLKNENGEISENLKKVEEDLKKAGDRDMSALLPPVSANADGRDTVNIIALAKQARDELMDNAKKANLHVTISSAKDTLLVKADQGRLITLFRNIIDNSIKYMNRAGSLVITISTIGDDIFIVLKDTGEGLSESETKHIFELNFQGSNRISGNGLGLAQAKAIVECYGGTIYAKSTEGKGMGIYIQLPA